MGVGALSDSWAHAWTGTTFFALVQKAKNREGVGPQSISTASGPFCVTCTYSEDSMPESPLCWLGLVPEYVRLSLAEREAHW